MKAVFPINWAPKTAFTNSGLEMSPLLNTSTSTPWSAPSVVLPSWLPSKQSPTDPKNPVPGTSNDGQSLAWALESSRYNLYNGLWASKTAASRGGVDYSTVRQGENDADGASVWSDLSTGLKPRVASTMKSIVSNSVAAAGQVWMLSTESGPFVNCLGVRASQRGASAQLTPSDYLTFMCPDGSLPNNGQDGWPGWKGMQGQWWGPGNHLNANAFVRYATDQMDLGPNDPSAGKPVPTGSTEDNFGVFADFSILVAAWLQMTKDLQGQGINPNGI